MRFRIFATLVIFTPFLLLPKDTYSLTMEEFTAICYSIKGDCTEHPILQAYVGGALDLIATLDEQTNYLTEIYCKKPATLFKVPNVIRYMKKHQEAYASQNAMLLFIRYFEEKGGCLKP